MTHMPGKGYGESGILEKRELALVRFLTSQFGIGEFYITTARGKMGFPLFWRGLIEKDRFVRLSGSISPYIKSSQPIGRWHSLSNSVPPVF